MRATAFPEKPGIRTEFQHGARVVAPFEPLAALALEQAGQADVARIRHCPPAGFAGRKDGIDFQPLQDEAQLGELPPDPFGLGPMFIRPHDDLHAPD